MISFTDWSIPQRCRVITWFNISCLESPYPPWGHGLVRSLLVCGGWGLRPVVARPRHLHEELPQLCDVIIEGRQGQGRLLLALLDEIPQTDAVHELKQARTLFINYKTHEHWADGIQLWLKMAAVVSDPDVPLGAQLFPRPVGFCSPSVWEGVKIQTLPSERTRTPTLIEVLTGLLTAETQITTKPPVVYYWIWGLDRRCPVLILISWKENVIQQYKETRKIKVQPKANELNFKRLNIY